jgi:hypothetical protein
MTGSDREKYAAVTLGKLLWWLLTWVIWVLWPWLWILSSRNCPCRTKVTEHLPSKHEALSSIPSTTKKKSLETWVSLQNIFFTMHDSLHNLKGVRTTNTAFQDLWLKISSVGHSGCLLSQLFGRLRPVGGLSPGVWDLGNTVRTPNPPQPKKEKFKLTQAHFAERKL